MMSLPAVDHCSVFFVWVLLQFLLQGACVGTLGLLATNRFLQIAPSVRYNILERCCIVLWSLPLFLLIEGLWQLNSGLQANANFASSASHAHSEWKAFLTEHSMLMLAIWTFGAGLLFTRLLMGVSRLHAMRLDRAPQAIEGWVQKNSAAVEGMRLDVYAADIPAPLVFGYPKHRLLVPQRIQSILGEQEIEALLLHELSHVQRSDYLRNLIHRTFVCLFWFHPFSWLLADRLAKVRELCCDADAIKKCEPAYLGRALVKLLEHGNDRWKGAAALSSLSADVAERLAALLSELDAHGHVSRVNRFQLLPTLLTILLCCAGAFSVERPVQLNLLQLAQDPQMIVHASDDAGPFELHVRNGMVLQAKIEGEVLTGTLISQRGHTVSLLDHAGNSRLVLTVEPTGRIAWTSRKRQN